MSETVAFERPARRFGLAALALAALGGAAVSGSLVYSWQAPRAVPTAAEAHSVAHRYQCPMHPTVVQDHPGDCPICGMKLVPIASSAPSPPAAVPSADGRSEAPVVPGLTKIEIDAERQQLIGLKTVEVARGTIGGTWRSVGRVAIDETRVRHVNLKVGGFVERIFVDFIGKRVRLGDPLFSLYSPELLAAQEEYLLALKAAGPGPSNDDPLVAASRRKLALWDVPDAQIEELKRTREPRKTLSFHSPISGVVTKKDVVQGMRLEAGAMPYEIVDLSTVWVLVDVYETDLRFVKEGLAARLRLNAFPDREFNGKVVFVDPLLDPRTRTVKVRLTFPNPSGDLRPEMFGEAELMGQPRDALTIPRDAVIDSGTEKVVFVASGAGKFEPRRVELGVSDDSRVEVLSGVAISESVVTRANFLVDSESRLRASLNDSTGQGHGPESARVLPERGAYAPPVTSTGLPTAAPP